MTSRQAAFMTLTSVATWSITVVSMSVSVSLVSRAQSSAVTISVLFICEHHISQLYFGLKTVKMTELDHNLNQNSMKKNLEIWNPWLESVQNEALDLTVKKDEAVKNDKENNFYLPNNYFVPYFSNFYTENAEKSKQSETIKTSKVKKSSKRMERKNRAKTLKKIESIKETCDCRFCYEDHIMKMRLKSAKSSKLLCPL